MTALSRLGRLGRNIGVTSGPKQVCPRCGGAGRVWSPDGEHAGWELGEAVADVAAEVLGEPRAPAEPEPDEDMQPCGLCHGLGSAAVADVAAVQAEDEASDAVLDARHRQVVAALAGLTIVEHPESPTLRAVD